MNVKVKIKRLSDTAKIPKYATDGSAGMDLMSGADHPITIPAGKIEKIPTGIAVECEDENIAMLIFARSGLSSKHGIALANGVGVVDPDYRGEILVSVINNSDTDYTVMPSERIAQMIFTPFCRAQLVETDELGATDRGEGGFGSTGYGAEH